MDMIHRFQRQHEVKVKRVQTDNAGELTSNWFEKGLADLGIKHDMSIAYIHETNGMAERFNRTITSSARALLYDSGLPLGLWAEAVTHASYTKNRMPHVSLGGKSPLEAISKKKPHLGHLQPFGSPAYVYIPEERRSIAGKLKERAEEGYLVGYTDLSNRYRFWVPNQNRITISRDFRPRLGAPVAQKIEADGKEDELSESACSPHKELGKAQRPLTTVELHEQFPSIYLRPAEPSSLESDSRLPSMSAEGIPGGFPEEQDQERGEADGERELEEIVTVAPMSAVSTNRSRSGREIRRPNRYSEWAELALMTAEGPDMPTVPQALRGPETREWQAAMAKEIAGLEKYCTWEEVLAPPGARFVDTKWVLKKKRDETGRLTKYKARLNARGFTQVEGLDYDETFAAVVRTDTIRLLLAHSVQNNLYTAQFDIEAAYLNAELEEELYLKPPPGVTVTAGKVLRLLKSIYGLKQAARAWADLLMAILARRGLLRSISDPALYINQQSGEFVAVHVDDLLYVSKGKTDFAEWLGEHLTVNALGRPKYLLSIELDWGESGTELALHQSAYIQRILKKFLPSGARPMACPMSPSERPVKRADSDPPADLTTYQAAIGSLLYAAVISRPDILYAVCQLSQFLSNPSEDHLRMAVNVFRYLAGTSGRKLTYKADQSDGHPLRVYSDASYANNLPDRRSFSGVIAYYRGCAVAWSSTKQQSVTLSTTEAEYVALTTAVQSLVWFERLRKDLGIPASGKPTLLGDNVSSHFLVRNASLHRRSKHIDVRFHFIREQHERGAFTLEFVSGKDNPADLFTKALAAEPLAIVASRVFG